MGQMAADDGGPMAKAAMNFKKAGTSHEIRRLTSAMTTTVAGT